MKDQSIIAGGVERYSIAYIIPYFGKLRDDLIAWIKSVEYNPTITWILFLDDKEEYCFPQNVKVIYTTFEQIRNRIQNLFEFEITLNEPYKLCDYRVVYGEAFKAELEGFDFWGYCDMDLMWGDIRAFLTEDILKRYDKIGFQGHSTLYRNTAINNSRYMERFKDIDDYIKVFSCDRSFNFDEKGINGIYNKLGVPFYSDTTFSTLAMYRHNFTARYWPLEDNNKRVLYLWDNGKLYHVSSSNHILSYKEVMYVHWQKRKMLCEIDSKTHTCLIVPDKIYPIDSDILNSDLVEQLSKPQWLRYIIGLVRGNRQKGLIIILKEIKHFIEYNKRVVLRNEEKHDING